MRKLGLLITSMVAWHLPQPQVHPYPPNAPQMSLIEAEERTDKLIMTQVSEHCKELESPDCKRFTQELMDEVFNKCLEIKLDFITRHNKNSTKL